MNTTAPAPEGDKQDGFLKKMFRRRPAASLRTVIENYIEKSEDAPVTAGAVDQEAFANALISNVLALANLTAFDVMVPRAEIIAMPDDISRDDLITFVRDNPRSRFPVYQGTLDEIVGMVHVKDLFNPLTLNDAPFKLTDHLREVPIISPALSVMDILHDMRTQRRHMMMVVDEYGGIDGLITAGDVIETVLGRLDDEHDRHEDPRLILRPDGSAVADAKLPIDAFEAQFGNVLTDEERESVDTLGGYMMSLSGSIPARGEVLAHEDNGMEFTILDADPRRVLSVLIRPARPAETP